MKKAVAVKYYNDLPAPFVLAKGKEDLARRLIKIARENNITILKEDSVAERLFLLEPGEFIPEEIYEIVANILAYVYTIHGEMELS